MGKNIIRKKRKGKQYHPPYNIKALGKNTKRGKGDGNFRDENQDKNHGVWEEYQLVWNFIHPCTVPFPGMNTKEELVPSSVDEGDVAPALQPTCVDPDHFFFINR